MGTRQQVDARRAAIAAQHAAGATPNEIARRMALPAWLVYRDLQATRNPKPDGRGSETRGSETRGRNTALLRAVQANPHRTLESFGQEFGVSRERIRQIIKRWTNAPKPKADVLRAAEAREKRAALKAEETAARNAARNVKYDAAFALRLRGYSYTCVAQHLGISTRQAFRRVKKAKSAGIVVVEAS